MTRRAPGSAAAAPATGWRRRLALGLLGLLALSGQACMPVATRQVDYGASGPALVSRDVEVETRAAYYDSAPACAFVRLPRGAFGSTAWQRQVAGALAAHFGPRLGRVVPAHQVRAAARSLALDPARPGHRARLARQLACPAVLQAKPFGGGDLHAGVWTQARVGLAVELRRAGDDALLWRARHVATRSAGGLPLSPLAAAGEVLTTAAFHADPELPPSLLHDATRRLAAALPALPRRVGPAARAVPDDLRGPSLRSANSARVQPSRSPSPSPGAWK
jgi:hypothetical protein